MAGPLVGRERELGVLDDALTGLRQGRGAVVLLVGPAGIGKTRLSAELAGRALAVGVPVAWGASPEGEAVPPAWPWRQALRSLGADPGVVEGDLDADPYRVVETVAGALRAAAPRGALVVLDDVHVADAASRRLLVHLATEAAALRVLLLVTARPVVGSEWLGELQRAPGAVRLDLGALNEQDLAALLPADAPAADLLASTGGNPLLVVESARALQDGSWSSDRPPRSVVDLVSARLARLSPAARAAVEAAAVVGRELDLPVLTRVLGTTPELAEASDQGLLDGTRFAHALVRDAVLEAVADPAALHRAAAAAVEEVHGTGPDVLGRLVEHHRAAGDADGLRRHARAAARDAGRRLAHEDAVRLARLALEVAVDDAERAALHRDIAAQSLLVGDLAAAAASAEAAAALAPDELADAALVLEPAADPALNATATRLCDSALGGDVDDLRRARLLSLRSRLAFYDGDVEATERLSGAAVDLAREAGDDAALVEALRARYEALPGPRGRVERGEVADEVVLLAERVGSPRSLMWGRLWQVEVALEAGRFRDAESLLPSLGAAVDRVGGPVARWHLDRTSACLAQAQGRYDDARALAGRAVATMRVLEPAPATGAWLALETAVSVHVGPSETALQLARAAFEPPARFRAMSRLSRALLLLGAGDPAAAEAVYLQAGPVEDWSLPVFFVGPGLSVATRVCVALGRTDDLARLVPLLEQRRGEHAVGTAVSYLGPVELALGMARLALGQDAEPDLRVAAEAAEGAGAPAFAAEARLLLARCLSGPEATRLRADGERVARALGAVRLVPQHTDPLSSREREVVDLVAAGLTNRQIAERLFLSERTAQNHVQNVLRKLGLPNRAAVAAWRAEQRNE